MSQTRSGAIQALAVGAGFLFIYTAVNSAAELERLNAPISAVSKQDYRAAVQLLQETDLDPAKEQDKDRADLILGYSYYRLADYENARKTLLEGLRPSSLLMPYRLYYAAHSCYDQGRHEASVELFQKLLQDRPSESLTLRSLYLLSYSRVALGDYSAAKHGLFMLEKLPGTRSAWKPDILYLRAEAEKGLENPEAADTLLKRLWIEYPLSRYAKLGEGYSYALDEKLARVKNLDAAGERDKALSELNPLIEDAEARRYEKDRLVELYRLRASIYLLLRRYAQAAEEIERLERLVKPAADPQLLYDKAKALSRLDRDSDAIGIYIQIWQNHPQSTLAPLSLHRAGRIYQLDLHHGEAIRTFRELIRNYPDHELARDALFQVGWIYYLKKKYKKAYEYLDKIPVLENEPVFNSRTLYWKAKALERLKKKNQAREIEQYIIKRYPYTSYACFLQGYFPKDQGNGNPSTRPKAPNSPGLSRPLPGTGARLSLASELVNLGLWQDATEELICIEDKRGLSESEILAIAQLYEQTGNYFRSHRLVYNHFSDRLEKSLKSYPDHARLAYPLAYADLVEKQARKNDLDPFLIMAVIYAESRYKPDVRSRAGALGLMQLMPATAKRMAKELGDKGFRKNQLTLPEVNLRYGCYHLAKLITEYQAEKQDKPGALVQALASYNAGKKQVREWNKTYEKFNLTPEEFIEIIPFSETRIYVRKVLGLYAIYRTIYPQGFPSQTEN